MRDSQAATRQDLLERFAFNHYLRTGRKIDLHSLSAEIEAKFNPYHDPDSGRFTTAEGAAGGGSARLIPPNQPRSRKRHLIPKVPASSRVRLPGHQPSPKDDGWPLPTLSPLHNEIRSLGVRVPPASGTKEWTVIEMAKWAAPGGDVHAFKRQWIHGYRDAIKAAAKRFDLPLGLVAGTVYNEVGGDPSAFDNLAYTARGLAGSSARDRTSFGDVSMQFRRAAEALGYDPNRLTPFQRGKVSAALVDPQTGIFIAAKHLSDLRNIDYRGIPKGKLGRRQVEVIGARYNRGPDLSLEEIEKDLDYGRDIVKRWVMLNNLVK